MAEKGIDVRAIQYGQPRGRRFLAGLFRFAYADGYQIEFTAIPTKRQRALCERSGHPPRRESRVQFLAKRPTGGQWHVIRRDFCRRCGSPTSTVVGA